MIVHNQNQKTGFLSAAIGVAVLIFGATGVFSELHDSLNTVWDVTPKRGSGVFQTLREKFLFFTMVLGIGFLLLVSPVISAGLSAFGHYLSGLMPGMYEVALILNFVIAFSVVTFLFAMMFKFVPDVEIAWRDVWIGAAITSLLFVIGKFLIGLYLGKSHVGSSYGAAGALILVLLWAYYSSQILFLGAELTQVYARRFGSRIVPSPEAEPLTDKAKAEQGVSNKKPEEQHGKKAPRPVP
jgi:membrane protein